METSRKHIAEYGSAIAALAVGFGLTIAGFIVPPTGEVHGSVLAVLGEMITYAAGIFGVSLYFHKEITRLNNDRREMMERFKQNNDNDE